MDRIFKYGYLELDLNKELFYTTNDGELITEEWRDIPNYEGYYQVSNCGRVKSLERLDNIGRDLEELILRQTIGTSGYYFLNIYKNSIRKTIQVHKLIALTFFNHVQCGHKEVIDHIDNNKINNNLSNLRVISNRENLSREHLPSSSKYVGVFWSKRDKKWYSGIVINGVKKYLGVFDIEKEASKYYQDALMCINENRIEDIKVNRKKYSSKHKGIYLQKSSQKWIARTSGKNKKHVGSFLTEEEAYQALLNYKKQLL